MSSKIFRYTGVATMVASTALLSGCSRIERVIDTAREAPIVLAFLAGIIAQYPIPSALIGVGVFLGFVLAARKERGGSSDGKHEG